MERLTVILSAAKDPRVIVRDCPALIYIAGD
jgi:hypothetical protein